MNKEKNDELYKKITDEIKGELNYRDIPYKAICDKVGLELHHFIKKINNKGGKFNLYELSVLCKLLHISIDRILLH